MAGGIETRKKVVVLGWYGHQNFGDEVMLEGLRQLFQGWDVVVMSDGRESKHPTINFSIINECDLFVLGGGELIHADRLFTYKPLPNGVNLPKLAFRLYAHSFFAYLPWVHKIEIPKVIFGCGVNTESISQINPRVVKALEQFGYIGLRDNTSLKILSSVPQLKSKLRLVYDPAIAIDVQSVLKEEKRNDMAAVIPTDRCARSDKGVRAINVASKSYSWLKRKLKPYRKVVFLPFGQQDNDDLKTCKILAHCSKYSDIIYPSQMSLPEVLKLISQSSITIPYRLHGLILSFLVCTNYEFYPYHWKLQRAHDTLKGQRPINIQRKQKACFEDMLREVGCD